MKSFQLIASTLSLSAVCADGSFDNQDTELVAKASRWQQNSPSSQASQADQKVDAITQTNVHDTKGGKSASYLEFSTNKVTASIDVLFWQASEDGLSYASRIDVEGSNFKNKARHLNFKYEPGFRVGLGTFFAKSDQWDLEFFWTHLDSKASGLTSNGSLLQIPWNSSILGNNASRAKAFWNLYYNIIDLELGRNFFISKALAARPFIGLRGAFIKQKYQVDYNGQFALPVGVTVEAPTKFNGKDNFWAIGIRPGVDLLWHFNKHWAFVGAVSTSLLYGSQMTTSKSSGLNPTTSPLEPLAISFKDSSWKYRLNVEGSLGFQWETYFNEHKRHLSMALIYEVSQWINQNQLAQNIIQFETVRTTPQAIPKNATLGLQGFTYKLNFAF